LTNVQQKQTADPLTVLHKAYLLASDSKKWWAYVSITMLPKIYN